MNHEIGGWLWLAIDVAMVVVLAGGIGYGAVQWRRYQQHPIAPEERDRATRDAYRS